MKKNNQQVGEDIAKKAVNSFKVLGFGVFAAIATTATLMVLSFGFGIALGYGVIVLLVFGVISYFMGKSAVNKAFEEVDSAIRSAA